MAYWTITHKYLCSNYLSAWLGYLLQQFCILCPSYKAGETVYKVLWGFIQLVEDIVRRHIYRGYGGGCNAEMKCLMVDRARGLAKSVVKSLTRQMQ